MMNVIQPTFYALLTPYTNKYSGFFSIPATAHLALNNLIINKAGDKSHALNSDMCKFPYDNWIAVVNWLQITYGSGSSGSELDLNCC